MKTATIHDIIRNKEKLSEFIQWLPDLQIHERFFVCLQARKKYMPGLTSADKTQLKRFTAVKENLLGKLMQLECPLGTYRTKKGVEIPDQAVAVYITPNPRDMKKATFSTGKKMFELLEDKIDSGLNPHAESLSCIHRSKGKASFVHFDIDMPNGENDDNAPKSSKSVAEVYDFAVSVVGKDAVTVIVTRGGCHLMIKIKEVIYNNDWYRQLRKELQVDQSGDLMVPIVGCCQGDFVPCFYKG